MAEENEASFAVKSRQVLQDVKQKRQQVDDLLGRIDEDPALISSDKFKAVKDSIKDACEALKNYFNEDCPTEDSQVHKFQPIIDETAHVINAVGGLLTIYRDKVEDNVLERFNLLMSVKGLQLLLLFEYKIKETVAELLETLFEYTELGLRLGKKEFCHEGKKRYWEDSEEMTHIARR